MKYERCAYMEENLYFKIYKFCLLTDLKLSQYSTLFTKLNTFVLFLSIACHYIKITYKLSKKSKK